jgi:hypothetical protein
MLVPAAMIRLIQTAPMLAPESTSVNQCTPRYSLDSPTRATRPTAPTRATARATRRPGRASSTASIP